MGDNAWTHPPAAVPPYRRTAVALLFAVALLAAPVAAQYTGRSFTITAHPAKATVGDTVRLAFRLVMGERDLVTDTVPQPVGELPAGIRVYSVEKLRRGADRAFAGEALVAFYRPGPQEIPVFGVPWLQIVTGQRGVIATEPARVEIAPVLPAGNPSLRDLKELELSPGPGRLPLVLAGMLLTALVWWLLRRRSRRQEFAAAPVPVPEAPSAPADPYDAAVARLDAIGRERLAERGEVTRHYEAVADTLRDYLEEAEEIPARERTSSELLWALPPKLTEHGLRRAADQVFSEADLVKFARRRPGPAAAAGYLDQARALLRRWHEARSAEGELDAVR